MPSAFRPTLSMSYIPQSSFGGTRNRKPARASRNLNESEPMPKRRSVLIVETPCSCKFVFSASGLTSRLWFSSHNELRRLIDAEFGVARRSPQQCSYLIACEYMTPFSQSPRPLRQKSKFLSPINADSTVHSSAQKYSALPIGQIISITSRHPAPVRGALRGRHDTLTRDAMDAVVSKRRTTCWRTTKSCGPDVSTLTSTRDDACASQRGWWQESPITREITKEIVKTIARGMPGVFRCDRGD